jgi:hypothetical protein
MNIDKPSKIFTAASTLSFHDQVIIVMMQHAANPCDHRKDFIWTLSIEMTQSCGAGLRRNMAVVDKSIVQGAIDIKSPVGDLI